MLADDIAAVLPELRAEAEAMMLDTVRITKPGTGGAVWDDDAGEYVDLQPVTIYGPEVGPHHGKSRWRNAYPAPQSVQAGGVVWAADIVIVSIPVSGAGLLENGCVVELLASPFDPASVGTKATVMADHVQTFSTACRVPCKIVTRHV
jgi:hypothetical protein